MLASELFADGRLAPGLGIFAGGTAEPITDVRMKLFVLKSTQSAKMPAGTIVVGHTKFMG